MDQHGDHHPPPHAVPSSWSSDNFVPQPNGCLDNHNGPPFHHRRPHHFPNHQHHHNFSSERNDSAIFTTNLPLSGHKRQFPHSPRDYNDGSCVKLYVRGVPRTVREPDIQSFFGQYGSIVEVVILKDKVSGIQQECCFVKYATVMEAERAIGAIHNKQTFPGATGPIEIKYAVGEQQRLGAGRQECKLYVGGLNKLASDLDVAEIFSPYGCVLEVFQLRDELKQNRGLAFIQFTQREMALAAIAALNGKYVMKGCDLPLIVRFAEPKKPRIGESRPGPYSREIIGQPMLPNGSNMHSQTGGGTSTTSSNSPAVSSFSEMADLPDCDWSEHICPDGNEYYYNCVTCESRWEKPEEYRFYEQHIQNGPHLHPPCQNLQSRSDPQFFLTHHAPPIQQELDHAPTQSVPSHVAVVAPVCDQRVLNGLQGVRVHLIY